MKKSQLAIPAMILFLIVIFAFSLISIFGYNIFKDIKGDLTNDLTSNESKQIINDTDTKYPKFVDGLFVFVFICFWVIGIVAALVADSHPILFIFVFIIVIALVIVGCYLGNAYEETMQDSDLSDMPSSFPMTHFLMTNMLICGIVVLFSILLVLFGKNVFGV